MTDIVQKFINERSAQNLPKTAKTRSGIEFYPNESLWAFRDGTTQLSLSFDLLPDECLPLSLGFKKTLLWYLENRAPSTAKQQFHNFIWLARRLAEIQGGVIVRVSLEAILTVKMLSDAAEHRLAGIRAFLVKWGELGGGGIDSKLVDSLGHLTLKQFPVGVAVATLDPNKGPLTDLEFEAIQWAVNNAYARSEINLESLLLCYLFMSLGVRPIQLASMKCCDLIVPDTSGGDYVLRVPRVKQREKMARTEFKFRKLTRQIGEALSHYVEMIVAEFDGKLDDAREAPLFPQRVQVDNANARDFKYHITSSSLSNRLVRLFASLLVSSERL